MIDELGNNQETWHYGVKYKIPPKVLMNAMIETLMGFGTVKYFHPFYD